MPNKIKEMIERIVKQFNPEKIILFGSYARGTETPDSDVDLLVVLSFSGSKIEKIIEIGTALNGMGISKDVFIASPDEIKTYKNLMGTIIYSALKEGKIIYERAA